MLLAHIRSEKPKALNNLPDALNILEELSGQWEHCCEWTPLLVCRPLFDAARPSRDQTSLVWTARGLPSGPQNKESKPSTSTAWVSGTHSLLSSRRFITFSITFRNRFRPSMYTFIVGMFTMGTSGWTAWLHHAVQACEIIQILKFVQPERISSGLGSDRYARSKNLFSEKSHPWPLFSSKTVVIALWITPPPLMLIL